MYSWYENNGRDHRWTSRFGASFEEILQLYPFLEYSGDPHANRNAVGKRVTTGWHSHKSREPFVEFHGFQSPGGSPR
jgi:hypothetical protein